MDFPNPLKGPPYPNGNPPKTYTCRCCAKDLDETHFNDNQLRRGNHKFKICRECAKETCHVPILNPTGHQQQVYNRTHKEGARKEACQSAVSNVPGGRIPAHPDFGWTTMEFRNRQILERRNYPGNEYLEPARKVPIL